ncbi:hypothetical protein L3X38_031535 [Prunus dulcis]|uniref:Reverse transcriptase Ty1/copia-type domain-containing protein n=1 Tax=Prunus dulcis TaxID=3755 RepID=A0AAD4YVQ6_PRUDU|nr:hypothetical protein L3X38_031535 [Prunus dulcis]
MPSSQDFDHTPSKYKSIAKIYEKCNMCIIEPESFEEVAKDDSWKKAMEDQILMINKNNTWELVNRPYDKPIIGVKWVYKTKLNLDGSVQKNKARLVAKGYSQKENSILKLLIAHHTSGSVKLCPFDNGVQFLQDVDSVQESQEEAVNRRRFFAG